MSSFNLFVVLLVSLPRFSFSLDNGLALTPPMGWMDWERFRCNTNCEKYPDSCIGEKLFMDMADRMAEDGFRDVGYESVSIDDCWMAKTRDSEGRLAADKDRFPHGIKGLADYIHSRKLKLGIYADYGTHTCAGFPGSIGHLTLDAQTFANWTVDYLKLDGCNSDTTTMSTGYPAMTKALNSTGRPIVFSCSWPAYLKTPPPYSLIAENCNLWRNYIDIQDGWSYVVRIIDFYAENQDILVKAAGPGHWNDPDQLIIGDTSLNYDQSKAQFAMWSIMASPLIMSNDLRKLAPEMREILLNKEVIDIDQDSLGIQGKRISKTDDYDVWCRPLVDKSVAVVLFNRRTDKQVEIGFYLKSVGFSGSSAIIRDLFEHKGLGVFQGSFKSLVDPTGVVMLKLSQTKTVYL